MLDRLHKEHTFPLPLYSQIKKNIRSNYIRDIKSVSDFVEELPLNLKHLISLHIYKEVYQKVDFLKSKKKSFISWICPLLKAVVASPLEYIFYEGDKINNIYFLKNGLCDYVLPKYTSQPFLQVINGTYFGVIDIIAACFDQEGKEIHDH